MSLMFRIVFLGFSSLFRYRFPHRFFHRFLMEPGSPKPPISSLCGDSFSIIFATFSEGRLFDAFWSPVGSPLAPFWLPLAALWLTLGSLWLHLPSFGRPFGSNCLPFGSLLSPSGSIFSLLTSPSLNFLHFQAISHKHMLKIILYCYFSCKAYFFTSPLCNKSFSKAYFLHFDRLSWHGAELAVGTWINRYIY